MTPPLDSPNPPRRPRLYIWTFMGVVSVLISTLLLLWLSAHRRGLEDKPGSASDQRDLHGQTPPAPAARPNAPEPRVPGKATEPSGRKPGSGKRINPEARRRLISRIHQRLTARAPAAPSASPASLASPPRQEAKGSLDKAYIQAQVKEIIPLVKECYDMALEAAENTSEPLEGVLKVRFSIIGDEELGGVIEDSQVLDGTPLSNNAALTECVQETMYGLQFEPPKGGGKVVVTYPMRFRTSEPKAPKGQP